MTQLTVPVNEHDHMLGKPDARVVLVEYADYQCPYCCDAYPIVKQVAQEFAGQVCVVFRNFPLVQAHPEALPAAMVAELLLNTAISGKYMTLCLKISASSAYRFTPRFWPSLIYPLKSLKRR